MFNKLFSSNPQGEMKAQISSLQEQIEMLDRKIQENRRAMESEHRNIETEWIKVQTLIKSQMGRIAKMNALAAPVEAKENDSKPPEEASQMLSHDEISVRARQQGLLR